MKTGLGCLLAALTWFAACQPVVAQPALGIAATNNQVILFWPATATNYVLQSAASLTSSNWTSANDATPVTFGPGTAAMAPNDSRARFFRLTQVPNNISDGMILIPAGTFTMGDTLDGESDAIPTATVNLSAYYMETNLVRFDLWQAVYGYATNQGYGFDHAGAGKGMSHPVQTVNWWDVTKWCNARSQQAGLTPVYYTDAALTQVFTNGEVSPYANWQANGYRLPTEAEWEKAARGGLSEQRFPWGNTISESLANYNSNPGSYGYDLGPAGFNSVGTVGGNSPATTAVGTFAPNGYGLFDMAGNVQEWCWDWYGTPYAGGGNPHGPVSGSKRVLHGGSWGNDPSQARCASRNNITIGPSDFSIRFGFRCVRGF
ncbi:MAG TPA: SUMF1/EgtB/PvdO family nonheme iron enzyme [Verrucomicrobiae bacterium]|nr:SUMF1/EgtB/PvdO family nonheme iron enzyme [Verrucomicrobiae bacterium]